MPSRPLIIGIVLSLFTVTLAVSVSAATQSGSLAGGAYGYYDLVLPNPQTGLQLTLTSSAATDFYLYTGVDHGAGIQIASSAAKLQHTLLLAPGELLDGGSYHVRIRAAGGGLASLTFTLIDTPTPVVTAAFSQSSSTVNAQAVTAWQWFRFSVPPDATLKGWDLRLKTTAGNPQMVVRRDMLPASLMTTAGCGSSMTTALPACTAWASGVQWAAGVGSQIDWTGRRYLSGTTPDRDNLLIMGIGAPLEAGTYYVGVTRQSGSTDATAMSYTLESRGIGMGADAGGSAWPIQIVDLPFDAGVVSGTLAMPRDVGWYRVTVPAGAGSWYLNLNPTLGEAMLAVRQGWLPNISALAANTSDNAAVSSGTLRQKPGAEYLYKYALPGQATITGGEYFIAVISEGQSPVSTSTGVPTTIGSGSVQYTLNSVGAMPVADMTAVPLAPGSPLALPNQVVPYGSQRVYRFQVPAGISSMELRLQNIAINQSSPFMTLRQDLPGGGTIPYPMFVTAAPAQPYRANEGGSGNLTYVNVPTALVTITQPVAGDYTLVVANESVKLAGTAGYSYNDALFDLIISAQSFTDIPFTTNSTTASNTVTNQEPSSWRFFRIVVPADANLLGWDLRLKTIGGSPGMVVRRDLLPSPQLIGSGLFLPTSSSWPSGATWMPTGDWTGRTNVAGGATFDRNQYLVMGMGNMLVPGTYYIGVSGADTMSYTLESRGIGIGTDSNTVPWPIQVTDLAFSGAGNTLTGLDLPAREAAYYRVNVPAGAKSWALTLTPTLGETMLAVRLGMLPNITPLSTYDSDDMTTFFSGTRRQKDGADYFYKYPLTTAGTITPGVYYLAVISEGQNPGPLLVGKPSAIGSATVNYTLTSMGEIPISDKTATPLTLGAPVSWLGETARYGTQNLYRFRAPAGLASIELQLKNVVGNPSATVRHDQPGSGNIPVPGSVGYKAQEGGLPSLAFSNGLMTLSEPAAGDYTVIVSTQSVGGLYPDTSYDIEVRALVPVPLAVTGAVSGGTLLHQQEVYYQVEVPATIGGFPVLAWQLRSSGAISLLVRKGQVPGATTAGCVVGTGALVTVVPPVLTPGSWFLEVKATAATSYTLSSDVVTADPARHQRSWSMPAKVGAFGQSGLSEPYFGDSGVDDSGNPLPGDQGIDLAAGEWHFYNVTVPVDNSGLLRSELIALNGTPEIYLRSGSVPTVDHYANPTNPASGPTRAYDRKQSLATPLLYGNWVALDGTNERQLSPGDWWIGVKAGAGANRYRLKLAAGDVHDAGGVRLDPLGYVQDLQLDGGSMSAQTLVAGDMRYYRVTLPQSSTTLSASTPLDWNLTLNQSAGDVVIFVRDTIPPGQGSSGNAGAYSPFSLATSSNFQDWYDDNSPLTPNPYLVIDADGTTSLPLPPLEPGKAYYLGVYARTAAIFDLASSTGAAHLPLTAVIPYINGSDSRTLAAGEQVLYRIDVPPGQPVWQQSATHAAGIQLYLQQGTVPPRTAEAHWRSNGVADSSFSQSLTGFPWQPDNSYYLLAENTTAASLTFSFSLNSQTGTPLQLLTVTVTGSGIGNGSVTSNPAGTPTGIACTVAANGTCSSSYASGTAVELLQSPDVNSTFGGWSGDCSGSGICMVSMTAARNVTASFNPATLVKVLSSGLGYGLLQAAYDITASVDTIMARGGITAPLGSLKLNRGVDILLMGGYDDSSFTTQGSFTELQAPLVIELGSLTVDRVIVR